MTYAYVFAGCKQHLVCISNVSTSHSLSLEYSNILLCWNGKFMFCWMFFLGRDEISTNIFFILLLFVKKREKPNRHSKMEINGIFLCNLVPRKSFGFKLPAKLNSGWYRKWAVLFSFLMVFVCSWTKFDLPKKIRSKNCWYWEYIQFNA